MPKTSRAYVEAGEQVIPFVAMAKSVAVKILEPCKGSSEAAGGVGGPGPVWQWDAVGELSLAMACNGYYLVTCLKNHIRHLCCHFLEGGGCISLKWEEKMIKIGTSLRFFWVDRVDSSVFHDSSHGRGPPLTDGAPVASRLFSSQVIGACLRASMQRSPKRLGEASKGWSSLEMPPRQ